MQTYSRRRFLIGSFIAPLVPIAADFTANQPHPKQPDDLKADFQSLKWALQSLILKALALPALPIYSVLLMLSSAIERREDSEFAEYVVKFDFSEKGGAK